jgi:hypothetical protein
MEKYQRYRYNIDDFIKETNIKQSSNKTSKGNKKKLLLKNYFNKEKKQKR